MIEQTDEQEKSFVIKIHGKAKFSEEPTTKNVTVFDDFVNKLFEEYKSTLQKMFDEAGELSYDERDEKTNEIIDPILRDPSFDTVTKDVH